MGFRVEGIGISGFRPRALCFGGLGSLEFGALRSPAIFETAGRSFLVHTCAHGILNPENYYSASWASSKLGWPLDPFESIWIL